jgi:hypothetical protein
VPVIKGGREVLAREQELSALCKKKKTLQRIDKKNEKASQPIQNA